MSDGSARSLLAESTASSSAAIRVTTSKACDHWDLAAARVTSFSRMGARDETAARGDVSQLLGKSLSRQMAARRAHVKGDPHGAQGFRARLGRSFRVRGDDGLEGRGPRALHAPMGLGTRAP